MPWAVQVEVQQWINANAAAGSEAAGRAMAAVKFARHAERLAQSRYLDHITHGHGLIDADWADYESERLYVEFTQCRDHSLELIQERDRLRIDNKEAQRMKSLCGRLIAAMT